MNDGTLNDTLKTFGRFRFVGHHADHVGQFGIQELDQVIAQLLKVDTAGAQHRDRVLILRQ